MSFSQTRALKSWLRMGFQNEGAPVPFEAVGLVLIDLFSDGKLYEGRGGDLLLVVYLAAGELPSLAALRRLADLV